MVAFTNILLFIFRQPNAPQAYPGAPPPAGGIVLYYLSIFVIIIPS